MTAASEQMWVGALRALGPAAKDELPLVARALLAGPPDLVAALRAAGESPRVLHRLMDLAPVGLALTALDLVVEVGQVDAGGSREPDPGRRLRPV